MPRDRIASPAADQSPFQCSHCQRVFSRVDHLTRHVRSHTQERPYLCRICGKGFGRADLVKRHTAQHTENASKPRADRTQSRAGKRVSQACKTCVASKLKCSDSKPCLRCVQRSIVCEYDGHSLVRHSSPDEQHPTLENDMTDLHPQTQQSPTTYGVDYGHDPHSTPPPTPLIHAPGANSMSAESRGTELHSIPLTNESASFRSRADFEYNSAAQSYTELLRDILDSAAGSPLPNDAETDGSMDLWNSILLSDQSSQDFAGLSHTDWQNFNEHSFDFAQSEFQGIQSNPSSIEQKACAAGTQAFRDSGWDWGPTHEDCHSAETAKLILPPDCARFEKNTSSLQVPAPLLLGPNDRNRLLSLLLQHCGKEQWIRVAPTFPSELLLDNILRRFIASQQTETLPWFHIPTLRPDMIRDELLAASVATGACFTPHEAIQRFGYVMPDILRYAIIDRLTHDNATSRDVQLLHAWLTQTAISMWSGNKRQMEIGEGNYQLVITIIRRARWLRREQYKNIYPESHEEGEVLHNKWQQWVSQEFRKRLIYRAFIFDAQISISNQVNPLMSYAEMRIPFPERNSLWWAATAEEWKAEHFKCAHPLPVEPLTLADAVRGVMSEANCSYMDHDLRANLYTLYGLWSLVLEYQQLYDTLQWSGSDSIHDSFLEAPSSMLPTRRGKLLRAFSFLRRRINSHPEQNTVACTETVLVLEYLTMALLVPLQGLQAFAGRDGQREARRVYPFLQEWTQTREARQGIWHAGQVYKAAAVLPSRCLRDLSVMLVYQASIAFWVFGVIAKARRHSDVVSISPMQDMAQAPLVLLDGEEDVMVRKFITVSEGIPALGTHRTDHGELHEPPEANPICSVEDAHATMSVAIAILRKPMSASDGAQIALVESITRLMAEIAKVAHVL
ncbi:hypothetical protein BKA66DRAFT_462660 [Pyrenochaeta sp. MPI-SDFR-AT-0127]|nr:hypothetical protein BKA66DRAFT_462660 [Pyrenochaeta sp. MPI-SDFR-AT-0127]